MIKKVKTIAKYQLYRWYNNESLLAAKDDQT